MPELDPKLAELLASNNQILKTLVDNDLQRQKELRTKAPAAFGTFTELHGNGSLFGSVPVEREVISAHIAPRGLMSTLTMRPSVFEQPHFASITGVTGDVGAEATNPCEPNPYCFLKGCNLTAQFGRVARDTKTIEIDRVMLRLNRGDFNDLILYGDLLGPGVKPGSLNQNQLLNLVTMSEMIQAVVCVQRSLVTMMWQGNPANNTAGGGYKEFPGLDRQINTGQVDAESNALCPALDSDVKDFAWDLLGGAGRDIVEYVQMLEYQLYNNAERMGLTPLRAKIVMRPELWHVLSEIWPCAYNTNRCANFLTNAPNQANSQLVLMGTETVSERDAMRNGMYIDINGRRYQVVVDDGIVEWTNATSAHCLPGQYASSLYFVPINAAGLEVCYMEHVDYRAASGDIALLRGKETFWTDDGVFFWGYDDTEAWCYNLKVKIEPRVVLRTPQLAGKIEHIRYEPLQHLRSSDPESPYFADGGVSLRPDTSLFHVW